MEIEEKSWFKKFFPGWFADGADQEKPAQTTSSGSVPVEGKGSNDEGRSAATKQSVKASTVARKMTMLKTALQFDGNVASQLHAIQSSQQLLLFVHEVLLYKFVRLGELGLLDKQSMQTLELVNRKLEAALLTPDQQMEEVDPAELARENELLKKQLQSLRAEHVKTGIVSERELQLDEECTYLKRRIRELNSLLHISKKRVARMVANQKRMESLQTRNSLLNSKVEHQTKLLRNLTAEKPEQQQLLAQMESLEQENRQLKQQLEAQFTTLEQLPVPTAADSPFADDMKSLLAETTGLITEYHEKEDRLETLTAEQPETSLMDNLDRLQEDNVQLKNLLKNKEKLDQLLHGADRGEDRHAQLATFVREGNQRMKELLAAKSEQFKVFRQGAEFRPLVRALFNAKRRNRELKHENQLKQAQYDNLKNEQLKLQGQLGMLTACQKQSRQLEARLESCDRQIQAMRQFELRYKELKKEHSMLRIQQERTRHEKQRTEQKLQRLDVEYKFLVSEYERLFSNL